MLPHQIKINTELNYVNRPFLSAFWYERFHKKTFVTVNHEPDITKSMPWTFIQYTQVDAKKVLVCGIRYSRYSIGRK